jgi:uncharacterized protein YjiS (DUF1127 family)
MTCNTQAMSAHASSDQGFRIMGYLKRELEAFLARRAQQATVRLLRGLDDHTLRDIGLGRSEIESLVYGRPGERRLRYDPR